MVQNVSFCSEQQLDGNLQTVIADFWQTGQFSCFEGVNNIRINYAYFIHSNHSKKIIIIPGRCESYLKYQELSYDLFNQGYNIFILDHRGQGLSERLQSNHNKGYVNNFQDYVCDVKYFIENISTTLDKSVTYLLAHSMGAAIATRYLQENTIPIQAAALASPMFGFNAGNFPKSITFQALKIANSINKRLSNDSWYFLGQKDYQAVTFEENHLTHSARRYSVFVDLYQSTPVIQLGGVTLQWLIESFKAQQAIFANLKDISTPILVLQASNDLIIDNDAQHEFCQQLYRVKPDFCASASPITIEQAYHELFFETDTIRTHALNTCLNWFSQCK
ncbi:alpha/beta fold hydrolase [Litorilituus lipolyticus]|uniref:Alpha/beta fold hydrolase n=1 Tax=Litorilituus lipolyticus TaxID=2491017 RepID=A0A502L3H6_9GAMM|nr:alpha/beta fold hydrolase [Litorilituus lipolyticus]TPH17754.1 alpha/beta fold hydrolase [Litorilituus lipolyticus]